MSDWITDESLTREEKLAYFDALVARSEGVELSVARGLREASMGRAARRDDLLDEEEE